MFAGQYFGQLVFAGELLIAAPAPPPPPPPEPVVYCDRYAIGRCIGVADNKALLPRTGSSDQQSRTPLMGTSGRGRGLSTVGTPGGPLCP